MLIQIAFTDAEIAAWEYERYRHPSPQVQKPMEVVSLKSQAVPHQDIARLCRMSRQTVVPILHLYQQEGSERLKRFHFAGQPSALNQQQSTLEAHLYSQYHATFPEFRTALETCLTTAQREHRIELETLLAWNFQSFRSVQTLPA